MPDQVGLKSVNSVPDWLIPLLQKAGVDDSSDSVFIDTFSGFYFAETISGSGATSSSLLVFKGPMGVTEQGQLFIEFPRRSIQRRLSVNGHFIAIYERPTFGEKKEWSLTALVPLADWDRLETNFDSDFRMQKGGIVDTLPLEYEAEP